MPTRDDSKVVEFLRTKDYIVINDNLGSGSFARTKLIQDPFIDELFVVKKHEPEDPADKVPFFKSFLQEIKILYKLNHRNIVRIYNYYAYEAAYTGYIIMEFVDGQKIDEYLDMYFIMGGPSLEDLFAQLIDGFKYLEENGVLHRDIREGNILVDKTGIVKIIDFGLGKIIKPNERTNDSMHSVINRTGLLALPDEYFDGTYTSLTDMFYLSELFKRLLVNNDEYKSFMHQAILAKMMNPNPNNRFSSFSEIQQMISARSFDSLITDSGAKLIYQTFSNSLIKCIAGFRGEKRFQDVVSFQRGLQETIQKNCLEHVVQDNAALIKTLILSGFSYRRSEEHMRVETLRDFEAWFSKLSESLQELVLSNLIAKLSSKIPEEIADDDLPF